MSEERRIEVIVKWLEQNKEVGEKLVSQLNAIRANLEALNQTAQHTQKTLIYGFSAIHDQLLRMKRASKEAEETTKATGRRFESFGKKLSIVGWRLSWMAYRLMMMGRIVMRWMIKPVNFAISTLTDWERSLDTVATSMGLLASAGELTGERQEFLQKILEGLAEVGPMVQGAFLYFQSALIGLVVQAGQPISEFFLKLGDLLRSIAPIVSETVIPAINQLLNTFAKFLPALKEIVVSAIPPFIQGLKDSIPILQAVLNLVKPFIPYLARLAGMLAPLAPLLMALGTALYFVTPLFQALGGVISHFPALLGALGTAFSFLAAHPMVAVVVAITAITATLIYLYKTNENFRKSVNRIWEMIKGAFLGAIASIIGGFKSFGAFIIGVFGGVQNAFAGFHRFVQGAFASFGSIVKGAFEGFRNFVMGVIVGVKGSFQGFLDWFGNLGASFRSMLSNLGEAFGRVFGNLQNAVLGAVNIIKNALRGFLDWIGALRKGIESFASPITGLFTGIIEKVNEFKASQLDLGSIVSKLFGHSIGRTIAEDLSYAIESVQEAQRAFNRANLTIGAKVEPRAGRASSASSVQYITISAPITIESISSSMDLDEVTDAVTDAISEAVREVMG